MSSWLSETFQMKYINGDTEYNNGDHLCYETSHIQRSMHSLSTLKLVNIYVLYVWEWIYYI